MNSNPATTPRTMPTIVNGFRWSCQMFCQRVCAARFFTPHLCSKFRAAFGRETTAEWVRWFEVTAHVGFDFFLCESDGVYWLLPACAINLSECGSGGIGRRASLR